MSHPVDTTEVTVNSDLTITLRVGDDEMVMTPDEIHRFHRISEAVIAKATPGNVGASDSTEAQATPADTEVTRDHDEGAQGNIGDKTEAQGTPGDTEVTSAMVSGFLRIKEAVATAQVESGDEGWDEEEFTNRYFMLVALGMQETEAIAETLEYVKYCEDCAEFERKCYALLAEAEAASRKAAADQSGWKSHPVVKMFMNVYHWLWT